jgi:hypothetical protein
MFQQLLAKRAVVKARTADLVSRTKDYYKENPTALKTDAISAVITLLLFNIEEDIEDVGDHTGVSAAVDYHTYNS